MQQETPPPEEPQNCKMGGYEVVQTAPGADAGADTGADAGADQPQDEEGAPTRFFGLSLGSWSRNKAKQVKKPEEGSECGDGVPEGQHLQDRNLEDDVKSTKKEDKGGDRQGDPHSGNDSLLPNHGSLLTGDASHKDPQQLLGCRVELKWSSGRWYAGTITSYDEAKRTHKVSYDDGDVRSYELESYVVRFLQVEDEWVMC